MNLQPSEIRKHILQHIIDNYSETQVCYDPNNFNIKSVDEYVGLHIDFGDGYTVMKGVGTTTRHLGLIHFTVYVKLQNSSRVERSGTNRVYEIIDAVLVAMERKRLNNSSVVTRAGFADTTNILDKASDNQAFALVSIPFYVT